MWQGAKRMEAPWWTDWGVGAGKAKSQERSGGERGKGAKARGEGDDQADINDGEKEERRNLKEEKK